MAEQKDEAYSAFLKKLGALGTSDEVAKDGVTTALQCLSYDMPQYELEDIEKLAEHLERAKSWSDLPALPSKLLDNAISIASEVASEAGRLEKGCSHFSNICHQLLVKVCLLGVAFLKGGGKDHQQAVVNALNSSSHWSVDDEPVPGESHTVATGDGEIRMEPGSLEHCIAAEEDDDDFIFESIEDTSVDCGDAGTAMQESVSDACSAEDAVAAYLLHCGSKLRADTLFTLPGSLWFSESGLDSAGMLVKELWSLSKHEKYDHLSQHGHLYLCLLLRMIESYPGLSLDVITNMNRNILSPTSAVPMDCLSLAIDRFALLPLSDMPGPCRREVLRLYTDSLNLAVAEELSGQVRESRRTVAAVSAQRLASLCGCVELAVLWGSLPLVERLLSSGVWRDTCCLAALSTHNWSNYPRHAVLAGCCRFAKLFEFAFRVPSLIATLPSCQDRAEGMACAEDFLWMLLQSQFEGTAKAEKAALESYLVAAVRNLAGTLSADDEKFAEWCLLSQILEALVTVRLPLRKFLQPQLVLLKAQVWPFLCASSSSNSSSSSASISATIPASDDDATSGLNGTDNSSSNTSMDAAAALKSIDTEESAKGLKPKWHQCRGAVLTNLKRLLDDDSGKCD
eukprot:scpid42220/ scgid25579/ 